MFKTASNEKIGEYISEQIGSHYNSARDFCRAWLTLTKEEINDETLRNKANKISQIQKGNKGVQITDLPIFAELLHVSVEELLSAGKSTTTVPERIGNYFVARSHDQNVWAQYLDREDQPAVNSDEFGKTILEYAIEFQNYPFIKYLMKNGYIWFDDRNGKYYATTFGAGTKLQRIKIKEMNDGFFAREPDVDDLPYKLAMEDKLRMQLICMAADQNDIKMLEAMRAREMPQLYYGVHHVLHDYPDFSRQYNAKTIRRIAAADERVIDYFLAPFDVPDPIRRKNEKPRKYTFLFPFVSQLLDEMIRINSLYTEKALERMIEYNQNVYTALFKQFTTMQQSGTPPYDTWGEECQFIKKGNAISLRSMTDLGGTVTNIAVVTRTSKQPHINELIFKLHQTVELIKSLGGGDIQ